MTNHYDDNLLFIEKWIPEKPISCVYYDSERERYYVKRFVLEDSLKEQPFYFLEDNKSFIEFISVDRIPQIEIVFKKVNGNEREPEIVNLEEFIAVKGITAMGNQLTTYDVKKIVPLEPIPYEEPEPEEENKEEEDEDSYDLEPKQASLFDDEE